MINKQTHSLFIRHSFIQSFLESILILYAGKFQLSTEYLPPKCNQNLEKIFPGVICDQIKIRNMGGCGFSVILVFICPKLQSESCLSTMLVQMEIMDKELFAVGVNMRYMYGIITDGSNGRWHFCRRRNSQRKVCMDVLNDPLLTMVQKSTHNNNNRKSNVRYDQNCITLAQERWQLFKTQMEHEYGHSMNANVNEWSHKSLYDGCVIDCKIRDSFSNLKKMSEILYGLIDSQLEDFSEAFHIGLQNQNFKKYLERPAINPFHEINQTNQKNEWHEFQSICNNALQSRKSYEETLTQTFYN